MKLNDMSIDTYPIQPVFEHSYNRKPFDDNVR